MLRECSFVIFGGTGIRRAPDGRASDTCTPCVPPSRSLRISARSLRSLACSGKGLPFSSRGVAVDALPMVARLPPQSAPFRSPPASACNRLSPAFRPAPLVVCCALAPLACFRLRGQVALPLRSLNQLPSLLAPLPVGFCSRPFRVGGSTGLACQVPRLVSAIPPCVVQSAAEISRPSGRAFAAAHRPSLFGFCLCAVPCAELLCGGAAAVGPRGRWARLRHAPLLAPDGRSLACALRPHPRLAPNGARPPLRFGRGIHWRYLRYSKFSRAILAREATSREN